MAEELGDGTRKRLELVLEHLLQQYHGMVPVDSSSDSDAEDTSGVGNERNAVWPVDPRLLCCGDHGAACERGDRRRLTLEGQAPGLHRGQHHVGHRHEAVARAACQRPLGERRCDRQRGSTRDVADVDLVGKYNTARAPVERPQRVAEPTADCSTRRRRARASASSPRRASSSSVRWSSTGSLPLELRTYTAPVPRTMCGTSAEAKTRTPRSAFQPAACRRRMAEAGRPWGTDRAAQVRLEVKPFRFGPTVHGPVVGHAEQDPPAERVSERARGGAKPRRLG